MHTTLAQPTVETKTPATVNYLSAFNSTTPSTGLYLTTPKTDYPIINDVSNGTCYQKNLYSYNQTTFNNQTNNTTNSYDQAAINRRKNATRETTNTLKAWLCEHRKNPYPTKGEKIMLAIITKMTLTQVSTWFANARRRLKKENKMTWEPRSKCNSGSGDEDDSSDIEYVGDENNENNQLTTTVICENEESKLKNNKSYLKDPDVDMINGHNRTDHRQINKCDDSDSNTSSSQITKQQPSPTNFDNNYGKETGNYSTDPNYSNNLENHDRFLPYHRDQLQFSYSHNRNTHPTQYHLAYSTTAASIQLPSVPNLTYAQSHPQLNDTTSIYNQIHSHHYNVHAQHPHHQQVAAAAAAANMQHQTLPTQQSTMQQTTANNLVRSSALNHPHHNSTTIIQPDNNSALQHAQHPVYHHVPNLNAHHNSSYSHILQGTYPADYMLAHHTHQLQQINSQINNQTTNQQTTQLNPNASSIYNYPPPPPPPTQPCSLPSSNITNLTQLTQVQSTNSNLYTSLNKSSPLNDSKSDENNNLDTVSLDSSNQMNSVLENTRKIWSLAQTATDSHSIQVNLNQGNASPASNSTTASNLVDTPSIYIDPTSNSEQQQQPSQQQSSTNVANSQLTQLAKGHSPNTPASLNVSSYMNNHLINNTTSTNSPPSIEHHSSMLTNNQLTANYNGNLHPHQNAYSTLDCGQIGHGSNTFLGKVFFDYISTGTTGPLDHERNNWTRIGLL